MIASLGIDTIRRPKKIKKARFAITKVSLKDISKIIMEFKDLPHEGYVGKRYKQMSTDSHFYLEGKLCKLYDEKWEWPCKNTKTSMQNMSNFNMSTQKMSDLHVCSTDERKSKRVTVNVCSMDESRPKSVHKNGYKREYKKSKIYRGQTFGYG